MYMCVGMNSAFNDHRFPPLKENEMKDLEISVSLLVEFEDKEDVFDWEVGTHGIRIFLKEGGRTYSATYLPEVASEQGWTKEETIRSLYQKAGYYGKVDKSVFSATTIQTYQSSKIHLNYDQWLSSE
jgi:AMME syndrome candidate gene 1 protein